MTEGQIVLFEDDDVRRITANWVEYGGAVVPGKAKNRRAKEVMPESVTLNQEHAVFDTDLCYRVGDVRRMRTRDMKRSADYAVRLDATIYPLSKLIYCAECERLAKETDNAALRTYLTGKTRNKKESRRYRHDTERYCPSKKRSVDAARVEKDFLALLESLTVKPEAVPYIAAAVARYNQTNSQGKDFNSIQAEIAYWRQRAQNADTLFLKARLAEEEWRKALETSEHEIALLELRIAQHTEDEIARKLTEEMVVELVETWTGSNAEGRRGLAHEVFQHVTYDLDLQKIVDFKLKPMFELIMQAKVSLQVGGFDLSADSGCTTDGKLRVLDCSRRDLRAYPPPPLRRL